MMRQDAQQTIRAGQAGDRASDPFGHPFVIAVCHREIAAYLGHQELIEITATPIGQRGHDQRQDNPERHQRQQQQARPDRPVGVKDQRPQA